MSESTPPTASLAFACVAVALGTLGAHGCGETVDLDSQYLPGFVAVDAGAGPTFPPFVTDPMPPSPPMVASTVQPLVDCASAGAGGIAGGGNTERCEASTSIQCVGDGRGVRANITPLDCELERGFVGDPQRLQTRCEEALDGQSGQSCQGPFSCSRSLAGTCCVQVATCSAGSALMRYRVCPSVCLGPSAASNLLVGTCEAVTNLRQFDANPGAWLGAPCVGQFVCPSAGGVAPVEVSVLSTEYLYYCANSALQMVPFFAPPPQ